MKVSRSNENFSRLYEKYSRFYENFSRYYEKFSRSYEKFSRYYEKYSRSYKKFSRYYEKVSRSYENFSRYYEKYSRYYENFSRLYEKISRYFEKISRSYEKYSRSYEKNNFFLLLFLTLVGFRIITIFMTKASFTSERYYCTTCMVKNENGNMVSVSAVLPTKENVCPVKCHLQPALCLDKIFRYQLLYLGRDKLAIFTITV